MLESRRRTALHHNWNKATIYKLAYDEQYRDFGVGSVLSREMFRVAIDEDHVAEIDYGVGSEPYKKDWMTCVRRLEGAEAFNRHTLKGSFLLTLEKGKQISSTGRNLFKLCSRGYSASR